MKSNKELMLKNGVLFFAEAPFNGVLIAQYPGLTTKSKSIYINGRKHGLETKWYSNKQKAEERYYSNGKKVKKHIGWRADGAMKFEYHFNANGAYVGNRKEWYPNGQLMLSFNYTDGKETGNQQMWNSDGKVRANYTVVGTERFGLIGLKKCYSVTVDKNELN